MLVLTRKEGEEIVISVGGVRVLVKLFEFDRGRVRVGITAPPEVLINRAEVQASLDASATVRPAK